MNLSISPVTTNKAASTSFGLAKFSDKGRALAASCCDVYTPLSTANNYEYSEFSKKKGFGPAPFTKFVKETIKAGSGEEQIRKITTAIKKCGTTDNAVTNANFIKQLVSAKPVIDKLPDAAKAQIAETTVVVFDKNYDNPELSKKDTVQLLEISKPAVDDKQYIMLSGVLQKSDLK